MRLSNQTYDVLKWIALILLPATATFIGAVGGYVKWEYTDLIVYILAAFDTLMGTLLGISNINYKKES